MSSETHAMNTDPFACLVDPAFEAKVKADGVLRNESMIDRQQRRIKEHEAAKAAAEKPKLTSRAAIKERLEGMSESTRNATMAALMDIAVDNGEVGVSADNATMFANGEVFEFEPDRLEYDDAGQPLLDPDEYVGY